MNNNSRRNIVLVGFSEEEKANIESKECDRSSELNKRLKLIFVDNLEEGLKHRGAFIVLREFPSMPKSSNFIMFDINYRHLFRNFDIVFIVMKYGLYSNIHSKIKSINSEAVFFFSKKYLYDRYEYCMKQFKIGKITKKRKDNIDKLYAYLKGKRLIKTETIADHLNVSIKWVKRYMEDVNKVYHNIGYDVFDKTWYIVKQK